jgi:hemerythrin-like domain-containing protein
VENAYQSYALGLKLSHAALTRNLERFVELGERADRRVAPELAAFVAIYGRFLDVHHRAEDDFVFPALRRSGAGRSTDAAHLDRLSTEHRDVEALGRELSSVATRLEADGDAFRRLAHTSRALQDLLRPHLRSEEELLTATHLPEMISEKVLAATMGELGRANRADALGMASFLAASLTEPEQQALFGAAPWIFRKLLGVVGARSMRRFRALVQTPTIAL